MNRKRRSFAVLFVVTCLCACETGKCKDISNEKNYAHLANATYKSQEATLIHGIAEDLENRRIDYYTITEPPGIAGPEVLSRDTLPKGTVIKIVRVERCNTWIPFLPTERLVIVVLSSTQFAGHMVELDLGRINIDRTKAFVRVE